MGLVFMIALSVANIWPLVFSLAVEKYPTRSNEISGLAFPRMDLLFIDFRT